MLRTKVNDVENPMTILKNGIVNLFSTSFTKIIGILLIPVYTRVLSTDEYGILELLIVFSNFLLLLLPFEMKASIGRFYFDFNKDRNKLKIYISQVILVVGFFSIIQIILYLIVSRLLWSNSKLFGVDYYPFIFVILLTSGLRVLYPIVLKLLQNRGDSIKLAQFTILYSLLGVLLNILFIVILGYGVVGFLYAYVITGLIIFVLTLLYLKNDFCFSINTKMIKESIRYSSPLLLSSLFAFLYQFADRFIISYSNTNSEVGIYSLAVKYAILLSLLHVALNRVLNPYFYSTLSKKNAKSKNLVFASRYNVILFIGIGYIMALFSQELINIIAPEAYSKAGIIAPIIILAYVVHSFYFNSTRILFFFKKTKIISISSIFVGGLSFLLNILLVPRFGSVGAASIFVFSITLHSAILYFFAQKTYKLDYNYIELVILIVILIIVFSILYYLQMESFIYLFSIKLFLSIAVFSFLFFRYFGIKKRNKYY